MRNGLFFSFLFFWKGNFIKSTRGVQNTIRDTNKEKKEETSLWKKRGKENPRDNTKHYKRLMHSFQALIMFDIEKSWNLRSTFCFDSRMPFKWETIFPYSLYNQQNTFCIRTAYTKTCPYGINKTISFIIHKGVHYAHIQQLL